MRVSLVPADYVSLSWDQVAPLLEKSIHAAHGRYSIDDILCEIVNSEQHLWVVFDNHEIIAALTTKFVFYPKKKILAGQFLGGERIGEWRDEMLETLERWATDNACLGLEMTGRKGFKKVLEPHGWTPEYVVYEKMFKE